MFNGCKIERIKNIWNVRTQDKFGSFGKGVENDVITFNFAMQEHHELGNENT
jgi:hypothetical protein